MRIFRSALCLLAVFLFASCAKMPQKSRNEGGIEIPEIFDTNNSLRVAYLYSEGVKEAADSGVLAAGIPYWRAVLSIDSLHGPTNHKMSEMGVEANPQQALKHSQRAVEADTTNIEFLGQYAYTQVAAGRYKAALNTFNKLLKKDSRNPYNYRMAAALYANEGMPYMAISILDSAEYKLGRIEELASYKRVLLMGVKNFDRATSETLSAIANNPFDHSNFRFLGEIYARTGNDSLALANFNRALELAPEDVENILAAGDYHLSRGDQSSYLELIKRLFLLDGVQLGGKLELYDKLVGNIDFYRKNFYAINTLCSILHIKYPDSYDVTSRYATHLIRGGEIDKALEVYKNEVAKGAAPLDAHLSLVEIESYLGLRDDMFAHTDQAIRLFPNEEVLYLRKAFELQRSESRGKQSDIVALYKKAIKVADDNKAKSDMAASLGDYYHSIGKPNKSFGWYAKALEQNPDNAIVLNNWAYFLSEYNQDLDRALGMSVRACELEPSNPTYLDTQAWILHLLGRTAEAKVVMRQAISLDTTSDDTLLLHYAEILAAEGDDFMAEMYYTRALKAGGDKEYINKRIGELKNK